MTCSSSGTPCAACTTALPPLPNRSAPPSGGTPELLEAAAQLDVPALSNGYRYIAN